MLGTPNSLGGGEDSANTETTSAEGIVANMKGLQHRPKIIADLGEHTASRAGSAVEPWNTLAPEVANGTHHIAPPACPNREREE